MALLDPESCYRAVKSRDRRFDGVFCTAVAHDRHLLPARAARPGRRPSPTSRSTPRPRPRRRRATAPASAACPTPPRAAPTGTSPPTWPVGRCGSSATASSTARASTGLARRIGYTPRHLGRLLTQELGAPPLALARARRAQTARVLIETTDDVALRRRLRGRVLQHPPVQRDRPRGLRPQPHRAARTAHPRDHRAAPSPCGSPSAPRSPVAASSTSSPTTSCRAWRWPARAGTPAPSTCRTVPGTVRLELADTVWPARPPSSPRSSRCRTCATPRRPWSGYAACSTPTATRWPSTTHLADDPVIGRLVRATPGLRVPGQVDGDETAVRTVIGQQVSVAGARTVAGRIVGRARAPHRVRRPGTDPPVPRRRHPRPGRPGDPADAPRAGPGAGRPRRGAGHRRRRPRPRPRPRRRTPCAPRAARHRSLDRRLRRDARAGPPRRLPAHRPRRPQRAARPRTPRRRRRPTAEHWRPWRSYALMHLWNTLMPDTSAPKET